MSNHRSEQRPPRVLFFGMECFFSDPVLATLLESGVEVCAVILPASLLPHKRLPALVRREPSRTYQAALPLVNKARLSPITEIAWSRQIPVWEVYHLADEETVSTLASYQPDAICVACFSRRIPRAVIDIPRFGCLNVHPSLLPTNRGPVPVFWTFREGCELTGVTIHLIDEGMDSGDILAQEVIEVPDGTCYHNLEMQCAMRGASLLVSTLWNLYDGKATRTPQDEAKSSYHSFPKAEDFVIPAEQWTAHHVYNFMRGVHEWGTPFEVHIAEEHFTVYQSISYSHRHTTENAGKAYYWTDYDDIVVRCKSGWVRLCTLHATKRSVNNS